MKIFFFPLLSPYSNNPVISITYKNEKIENRKVKQDSLVIAYPLVVINQIMLLVNHL